MHRAPSPMQILSRRGCLEGPSSPRPRPPTSPVSRLLPGPLPSSPLVECLEVCALPDTSRLSPTPTLSPRIPCGDPVHVPYTTPAPCSTRVSSPMLTPCPHGYLVASCSVLPHLPTIPGWRFLHAPLPSSPRVECLEIRDQSDISPTSLTPTLSPRIPCVPPGHAQCTSQAPCWLHAPSRMQSPFQLCLTYESCSVLLYLPSSPVMRCLIGPLPSSPLGECLVTRVPPDTSPTSPTPTPSPRIPSAPLLLSLCT